MSALRQHVEPHHVGAAERPGKRPRPPLHAVLSRPRRRPQRRPRAALCSVVSGLLLVPGVIGVVALNAFAAEASFQARELEAVISDLTLEHDDLVAEVASLEAPDRVREVAGTQLGLIEPEQPGFITLDPAHLSPATAKPEIRLDSSGRRIGPVLAAGRE